MNNKYKYLKINKKEAFTLAEAVITMSLLAVIASILIPTATGISPSNTKTPLRNAFGIISTTTASLISNEILYPSNKIISFDMPVNQGFLYTITGTKSTVTDGKVTTVSETNDLAWEYENITKNCVCSSGSKLVRLFCCSMNVTAAKCSNSSSTAGSTCNFTTNNGMVWNITQDKDCSSLEDWTTYNCSESDTTCINKKNAIIQSLKNCRQKVIMTAEVDVNGNASPNSSSTHRPDRFKFDIYYNGRIELDENYDSYAKAREYLEAPTNNKRDQIQQDYTPPSAGGGGAGSRGDS